MRAHAPSGIVVAPDVRRAPPVGRSVHLAQSVVGRPQGRFVRPVQESLVSVDRSHSGLCSGRDQSPLIRSLAPELWTDRIKVALLAKHLDRKVISDRRDNGDAGEGILSL